jgi:hypothetical protein
LPKTTTLPLFFHNEIQSWENLSKPYGKLHPTRIIDTSLSKRTANFAGFLIGQILSANFHLCLIGSVFLPPEKRSFQSCTTVEKVYLDQTAQHPRLECFTLPCAWMKRDLVYVWFVCSMDGTGGERGEILLLEARFPGDVRIL